MAAAAAGSAIRVLQARRRRPCTPTLYGLAPLDWLMGPLPPYGDVDGDDGVGVGVGHGNGRLRWLV